MSHTNAFVFAFPEPLRAMAESSVSQARANYSRLKMSAEERNGAIEAVRQSAANGVGEYASKMLDVTKANTEAAFDLAHDLAGATSPAAFTAMWTGFAHKQIAAMTSQSRELADLSRRIAMDVSQPVTRAASAFFRPAYDGRQK